MPPVRRSQYTPFGNPASKSEDERQFQVWLRTMKIPLFERYGVDHTVVSLRPVQGGARLECPVCFDTNGNNVTVETSNEVKKHRHEGTTGHKRAAALYVCPDPTALMMSDICPRCNHGFSRHDSFVRHWNAKSCLKGTKKTTRTRAGRAPASSSRESSAEWTPPPAPAPHPYARTLRSSSRRTTTHRSASTSSPEPSASSSSAASPEPFFGVPSSSSTPMTSRAVSPLAPGAAAELCLDLEKMFMPSSSGSREPSPTDDALPSPDAFPAEPFPAQAAAASLAGPPSEATQGEHELVFDAYSSFAEDAFPMCALSTDFGLPPSRSSGASFDVLNASLSTFTFEATVDPFGPRLGDFAFAPACAPQWDWPASEPARDVANDEEFMAYLNEVFQ